MKKDNIEEHFEEEIKMNNQNNKNSNKDDLKIKELAIKEDKSKSNSINVTIPNENISPNIIGNLFILNNFWHINNINTVYK